MSEGKLPNFARLQSDGAYGTLKADPPLLSPVLWTTMATGKSPTEHGIGHFVAIDPASGSELPATSSMRKVKAVWNIASESDKKVATVGWWATWPPEEVNGSVVSDHTCYHFLFKEGESGGSGEAVTHPAGLIDRISTSIRRPSDVSYREASRYIDVPEGEYTQQLDISSELYHFRWALATTESYADISLDLWREEKPDLLMVYIESTDSVSHLFGHLFRTDNLVGELAEQKLRYGRAVEEIYVRADEILGRFIAVVDSKTTLMVMSDHGFMLGELHDDPSKTRDLRRVSERYHRELGILYLYGNRVDPQAQIIDAHQLDITPTVLTLLGLAQAEDMPGRVLDEALQEIPQLPVVVTYEDQSKRSGAPVASNVDEQILAHLKALGYLDEDVDSPQGRRNIAAIEFKAGNYERAQAIYAELIAQTPKDANLHASLAGCFGAQGRYQEALQAISDCLELQPVSSEALHNRAVIHERLGNIDAAVEDYRQALRYDPRYEPSRVALINLTGSGEVRIPTNETEAAATHLAEEASAAARRGAYDEALRLLDQAATTAPDFVLVYQYQSNVAFLMGDFELAEKALTKALELEPNNELFKQNLENVHRKIREN